MPRYVLNLPIKKTIQVRKSTADEIRSHIEIGRNDVQKIYVHNMYGVDTVGGVLIDDLFVPDGDYVVILDVPGDGVAIAAYNEEEFANALISSN